MKTTQPIFPLECQPIVTERLKLRPHAQTDLDDCHQLRSQIEVMQYTSKEDVDADISETQTWLDRFLPPNLTKRWGFVIEERSNPGKVIGSLAVHRTNPQELGYMLRKEMWRKGYASEAVGAFLNEYWKLPREEVDLGGDDRDGFEEEVLLAHLASDNEGSKRLLLKLGFEFVKAVDEQGKWAVVTLLHYRQTRPAS